MQLSKLNDNVHVVVGYTADYAIFVHENLEAYHAPPTQAKFLEQPAREMQEELRSTVRAALKRKLPMGQALLMAGLQLQAASQRIVPVATGALRASAFTELERE